MIKLKGLDYELELVKDDRYRIYYNEERNVAILAIAYCKDEPTDLVFNGISEEPYKKLIKFMNENNNLIIKWTKVEGTTSDYTIYCNCNYVLITISTFLCIPPASLEILLPDIVQKPDHAYPVLMHSSHSSFIVLYTPLESSRLNQYMLIFSIRNVGGPKILSNSGELCYLKNSKAPF